MGTFHKAEPDLCFRLAWYHFAPKPWAVNFKVVSEESCNLLAGPNDQGRLSRPYCYGVNLNKPTPARLNCVFQHCLASAVPHVSPLLASSLIFSGSANVSFLGRGVLCSASRIALASHYAKRSTCRPDGMVAKYRVSMGEEKEKISRRAG